MIRSGYILAIDPGVYKFGLAVVSWSGECKERYIVAREELFPKINQLLSVYDINVFLVGKGTGHNEVYYKLKDIKETILIEEKFSTWEAKRLYFKFNPPGGLRKLIPISLLSPSGPIDDLSALVLARRFLKNFAEKSKREINNYGEH